MTLNEFLWDLIVFILFIMGCMYCFYPIFYLNNFKKKYLDPIVDPIFKKYFEKYKFITFIIGMIFIFLLFVLSILFCLILLSLWSYLCGFTPIEGIPFVNYWYNIIPSLRGVLDITSFVTTKPLFV